MQPTKQQWSPSLNWWSCFSWTWTWFASNDKPFARTEFIFKHLLWYMQHRRILLMHCDISNTIQVHRQNSGYIPPSIFLSLNLLTVSTAYKLQRQELFTLKVWLGRWAKSRDRSFSWHAGGQPPYVHVLDIVTSHEDSTPRTSMSCLNDLLWNSGFWTKGLGADGRVIIYCVSGAKASWIV